MYIQNLKNSNIQLFFIAVIELELMHGTCTCPFYERDYPHKDEVLKIIIYKFTNFFSEIKFNQV